MATKKGAPQQKDEQVTRKITPPREYLSEPGLDKDAGEYDDDDRVLERDEAIEDGENLEDIDDTEDDSSEE